VLKGEGAQSAVPAGDAGPASLSVHKHVRVNGVARRSVDVLGQINVVMFTAQDIELATGKSALCRRYLDLLNCQLDRLTWGTSAYQKVLVQRNHLLRLLQEGQAQADQLEFWDEETGEERIASHHAAQMPGGSAGRICPRDSPAYQRWDGRIADGLCA